MISQDPIARTQEQPNNLINLHTLDLTGLDVPSPTAKRLLANMNLKDFIY